MPAAAQAARDLSLLPASRRQRGSFEERIFHTSFLARASESAVSRRPAASGRTRTLFGNAPCSENPEVTPIRKSAM